MRTLPHGNQYWSAVVLLVGGLATLLYGAEVEVAPPPRPAAVSLNIRSPLDLDRAVLTEIRQHSQIMRNLQYLSDVIGARLTGSPGLERANRWTAEKLQEYGLVNVRLDPWEIPVGWQRGHASMRIVEPDTGLRLLVASAGWTPGTAGKVTGPVVIIRERTRDKLEQYKGKLRNAVVLLSPPPTIAPVTDLRYGPPPPLPSKDAGKKKLSPLSSREPAAHRQAALPPDEPVPYNWYRAPMSGNGFLHDEWQPGLSALNEFLKSEGVACVVTDAAKPHGLLVTTGGWPADIVAAQNRVPRLHMAHEHYSLLWRLATQGSGTVRVETEIQNTFIRSPITVYNTVGEIRGSEKPEEIVVVGAHLDSWDLASGTTDNGTGSCVVLEVARALATLARQGYPPKRTIRFVLFSGEEQGLHGSRHYVQRYKNELPRHSAAIVHDTGTGRVYGLACYRSQDGRSPGFNGAVSCSVSPERVVLFAKYLAERSVLAFI